MESSKLIFKTLHFIISNMAIIFALVWIIRRMIIRRKEIIANKLEKIPYSGFQIFGIIGILFILLPISWSVGKMLLHGVEILAILLVGWIELPNPISRIIQTAFFIATQFFLFLAIYLVCESMWPKRYKAGSKKLEDLNKIIIERYIEKKQKESSRSSIIKNPKFRLGFLVFILLFLVLFVVYSPGFFAYRSITFCTKAESDAHVIAAHVVDYLSDPNHTTIPTFEQLRNWKKFTLSGKNTAKISSADPNGPIIITVKDGSGKCRMVYQNARPNWDGNGVYKLTIAKP